MSCDVGEVTERLENEQSFVPEFAAEDLPLGRTATLVSEFE